MEFWRTTGVYQNLAISVIYRQPTVFPSLVQQLRHLEEVAVDIFTSTVSSLAEKDENVIAFGEFSRWDRQHNERLIFAEPDFARVAAEDFLPFGSLES